MQRLLTLFSLAALAAAQVPCVSEDSIPIGLKCRDLLVRFNTLSCAGNTPQGDLWTAYQAYDDCRNDVSPSTPSPSSTVSSTPSPSPSSTPSSAPSPLPRPMVMITLIFPYFGVMFDANTTYCLNFVDYPAEYMCIPEHWIDTPDMVRWLVDSGCNTVFPITNVVNGNTTQITCTANADLAASFEVQKVTEAVPPPVSFTPFIVVVSIFTGLAIILCIIAICMIKGSSAASPLAASRPKVVIVPVAPPADAAPPAAVIIDVAPAAPAANIAAPAANIAAFAANIDALVADIAALGGQAHRPPPLDRLDHYRMRARSNTPSKGEDY